MKMENLKQEQIIRKVSKVGNGAHVFVPKEWVNEEIIIVRAQKLSLKEELMKILSPYTEDVIGIYIIGSYARGEQSGRSDVDLLVVTNKTNKLV